ncbi:pyridoxamine 5'-phosphate oxidase family protein [Pectinatus frisingensis]|jgi:uncharacterized pyridoxamine 5'-phosphate oxidase family protein|uniref:pyridoxamine 5'-phosphate oxidase family protein n=1 Tax=Pectinatus frisingensis TaxID=865 RepID=UPI0015F55D4B|nr:pyridoxamine 5'-phosphate oxidase family protein [Pectinatus frisingensis]
MSEVLKFLQKNKIFYLATTVNNVPHVRPLGFIMEYNGKLTFCTSNKKAMYKQLIANPEVEICCVDADYNFLRIKGKAEFCTNSTVQQKALQVMPSLGNIYSVGDGVFEIFSLNEATAILQTMSGEKRRLEI